MFEQIMKQQGSALETMMINQPVRNHHLMDEAIGELNGAIKKAITATLPEEFTNATTVAKGTSGPNL